MNALRSFWANVVGVDQPNAPVKDDVKKIDPNAETDELKAEIMKRLAALVAPYKEAVASNRTDVPKLKELFEGVKSALSKGQYAQAVEALDSLEKLLAQRKAPNGVAGVEAGAPVEAGGDSKDTPMFPKDEVNAKPADATADGPIYAAPAKAGPHQAGDDKDEVKIEVSYPGLDPTKVKAVVQQMLKELDKELNAPATKKRIIAAMASKGKFSPSGGIDPYSEIDAEESVTLDIWSELVAKARQQQPFEDAVWEADKPGRAVIKARFERRRGKLEKTVPRTGMERLQYDKTRVDQQISEGKQRLAALAKQLAEQEALLKKLDQTDGRNEDEKKGNEPPRKPWAKMDAVKKRIENLKWDVKYERDLVEKDLPKKARELDDQIAKEERTTLYFEITAVTDMNAANPQFALGDDTDKKWKLVLPSSEKDPQGRARALKESGKAPWKIALPRKVRLDIYHLRNKRKDRMCGGWMVFKKGNTGTKPDSYEDLVGSYEGWQITKSITEWIDLAWSNNTVQAAATANMEIKGTTS